jgi:hypothetical protein
MRTPPRWWPDLLPAIGGVFLVQLFVRQFLLRVGYPFDLEWMEGGMLLHADRVLKGEGIYVPPSMEFIPFIYPPLYPWVLAACAKVFGLGYAVGRTISFLGTLVACGALVAAVRREGGTILLGLGAVGLFLSTYDETGAFMDLVRADGLTIALLSWSFVCARGQSWRAAGLLLVLAFMGKHTNAVFGLPTLLWAWRFHGRAAAIRYALWSVVPALLFTGGLELATHGWFLTYLVGVPSVHPYNGERGFPGAQVDVAQALPVALVLGLCATALAIRVRRWMALALVGALVGLPLAFAFALQRAGTLSSWQRGVSRALGTTDVLAEYARGLFFPPEAFAFVIATPFLLALFSIAAKRVRFTHASAFWSVQIATGIVLGAIMRAHHGGYVNVLLPAMWLVSLWAALGAQAIVAAWSGSAVVRLATGLALLFQCAIGRWDLGQFAPTPEDVAAGTDLVERLRAIDGDVFSPQHPYYPVLAGKKPSFALISLWDINHARGPLTYFEKKVERAFAEKRWAAVLTSDRALGYGLEKGYVRDPTFRPPKGRAMRPKSGWPARPSQLWIPKP